MKLFVASLPADFDDVDLKEMFELYGEVSSAKVIVDRATGKSKGFGFLEMEDDQQAKKAIKELDGSPISDRNIVVRPAETQDEEAHPHPHKRPRIAFNIKL